MKSAVTRRTIAERGFQAVAAVWLFAGPAHVHLGRSLAADPAAEPAKQTARRARNPRTMLAVFRVCVEAEQSNLAMEKAERRWAAHAYRPKECNVLEVLDCARRLGFGEDATEGVTRLCHTIDQEKLAYHVKLVAGPEGDAAGARWFFICPLSVNGVACDRHVPRLYRPPPARYFGCAQCQRVREGRRQR
jgi:hypothetical protein